MKFFYLHSNKYVRLYILRVPYTVQGFILAHLDCSDVKISLLLEYSLNSSFGNKLFIVRIVQIQG